LLLRGVTNFSLFEFNARTQLFLPFNIFRAIILLFRFPLERILVKFLKQNSQEQIQHHKIPKYNQREKVEGSYNRVVRPVAVNEDCRPALIIDDDENRKEGFHEGVEGLVPKLRLLFVFGSNVPILELDVVAVQVHAEQRVDENEDCEQKAE